MEVPFELPALLVAGLDDARPRRAQVLARLGARDRQRDELAEGGQALFGVRGSVSSLAIATAPHVMPATVIGADAVER